MADGQEAVPRVLARPGAAAITAVVLTLDESAHLGGCLDSLGWVDDILVLDSGSKDGTVDIARAAGARVELHPFADFGRQRQFALDQVATEWTLFVDADERVPTALALEVAAAVEAADGVAGYWMPRRNFFWGREIRGGGWWPDLQLRLLRTSEAHFDPGRPVHEVASLRGTAGVLREPLVHLNYDSWNEFRSKQRRYALLEAGRRAAGRPARLAGYLTLPVREFAERYVRRQGWRDGTTGLALAAHMAFYEAVIHREVRHLQARRPG
jgi:glycosyltransferase involved in cell wall biosynthesis